MSEQRLIDATELRRIFDVWLSEMNDNDPEDQQTGTAIYDCACQLDDAPTIDPETLPIVRELRGRNKRLKAVVKVQLEQLREKTSEIDELCEKVADLDEKLQRVASKRDAAVADLRLFAHKCGSCKWFDGAHRCTAPEPCNVNDNWEWRGPDGDNP